MRRGKFALIAALALTGLVGGSAAFAGNLVINGSFENSAPANGKAKLETFNPNGTVLTPGAVIPNWTLDINASAKAFLVTGNNDSQSTGYLQVGVSPSGNFDGSNYFMVDSGPKYSTVLYQTVDGLVKGQQYDISFYQASSQQINTHGATTDVWQVGLGDNLALSKSNFQTSALMNNPSAGSTPWTLQHIVGCGRGQPELSAADRLPGWRDHEPCSRTIHRGPDGTGNHLDRRGSRSPATQGR